MAKTIAISGKGGTGKTTLAAMIIRSLLGKSPQAILAVDADANACLGMALGIAVEGTISDLRDDFLNEKPTQSGISKLQAFGAACEQLLSESKGIDLLTMGRPEGPGCYCAVNNVLRGFLSKLSSSYGYVITDNEAGMEHLSRRTTDNLDLLIIAAEVTQMGIVTAERIIKLVESLPISIGKIGIIWNKTTEAPQLDLKGVSILGTVPYDESVCKLTSEGGTIFDLDENSPALNAVREILQEKVAQVN